MNWTWAVVAGIAVGVAVALIGFVDQGDALPATTDPGLDTAFEWNVTGLTSQEPEIREAAFDVFRRNWDEARASVAGLADSPVRARRIAAGYLLARLGDEQDLPGLRCLLGDSEPAVRLQALWGLRRLGDTAIVRRLEEIVEVADFEELQVVVDAIVELDPQAASRVLDRLAVHEDWANRRVAAQASAELGDAGAADRIAMLLDDPVWFVRRDAADSAAALCLESAHERLLELTTSDEWSIRAASVKAIGRIGRPDDYELLTEFADRDDQKYVRIAAIEGLASFDDERTVPLLESVLGKRGEHKKVLKAAVSALARRDSEMARSALQHVLDGAWPELREIADAVLASESTPTGR